MNTEDFTLERCEGHHIFMCCPPYGRPLTSRFCNRLIPGAVYYARIDLPYGPVYKIGQTKTGIKRRYHGTELGRLTLVAVWMHHYADHALRQEQAILKKYKAFKHYGPRILKSGDSEIFDFDVLGLDNVSI